MFLDPRLLHPQHRIPLEETSEDGLGVLIQNSVIWEDELVVKDSDVHVCVSVSPEGCDSGQHLVQHGSERPPINFVRVSGSLNDLWGEVLGSSTEGSSDVSFVRPGVS